jgi:hypothetical protein
VSNEQQTGDYLFEVPTPIGFRVHVSRSYWELIVTVKHPVMARRELEVKDALQDPVKFAKVGMTLLSICSTSRRAIGGGFVRLQNGWMVKGFW